MSTVRQKRQERGLTQEELSELSGIHQTAISRIENGGRPRLDTARALAAALGVPVDELFPLEQVA